MLVLLHNHPILQRKLQYQALFLHNQPKEGWFTFPTTQNAGIPSALPQLLISQEPFQTSTPSIQILLSFFENRIVHSLFLLTAFIWEAKLKTELCHYTADAFLYSSLPQTQECTSWWGARCLMETQKIFLQGFISGRKLGYPSFPPLAPAKICIVADSIKRQKAKPQT